MRIEPKRLNKKIAESIHLDQMKQHGGSLGVRDESLLESALDRTKSTCYYYPKSTIAVSSTSVTSCIKPYNSFFVAHSSNVT